MAAPETIHIGYAFGFALVGRLLDILSTYLVTPTLMLEGNRLARRFGWKFAWASVLLAFFAFASPQLGIAIGTMSCVMALSNMQTAPLVRYAGGEAEFAKLVFSGVRASSFNLKRSLLDMIAIPLPVVCIGAVLLSAVGPDDEGIVGSVAYGLLIWGAAVALHRTLSLIRICNRRRAARHAHSVAND